MNKTEYDKVADRLLSTAKTIEDCKRPAYTRESGDVLINFKRAAEKYGISPMQAWGVFFDKHTDAIASFAKDPSIVQAEPLESRFADAINYLRLGWAIAIEEGLVKSDKREVS